MNTQAIQLIVGAIIRHGMTAAGLNTVILTDDVVAQAAGAVVTLAGLGWSLFQKLRVK